MYSVSNGSRGVIFSSELLLRDACEKRVSRRREEIVEGKLADFEEQICDLNFSREKCQRFYDNGE